MSLAFSISKAYLFRGLTPNTDGIEYLGCRYLIKCGVAGNGDPAGCHQVIGVGCSPQVGVGRLDYVDQVLGPIVTQRRDLNRLVVTLTELRPAQHAEVDGPAMWDVAHCVDDLAAADLFAGLPVDQALLTAGVDVHNGGVARANQRSACPLQAGVHVVWFALTHCRPPCLLAAPASIASTKRIAAR